MTVTLASCSGNFNARFDGKGAHETLENTLSSFIIIIIISLATPTAGRGPFP